MIKNKQRAKLTRQSSVVCCIKLDEIENIFNRPHVSFGIRLRDKLIPNRRKEKMKIDDVNKVVAGYIIQFLSSSFGPFHCDG